MRSPWTEDSWPSDPSMVSLEQLTPAPLHRLVGRLQGVLRGRLWLAVILGLSLGILAGFGLGPDLAWVSPSTNAIVVEWAAFPWCSPRSSGASPGQSHQKLSKMEHLQRDLPRMGYT